MVKVTDFLNILLLSKANTRTVLLYRAVKITIILQHHFQDLLAAVSVMYL